jgi:hypothetical protein
MPAGRIRTRSPSERVAADPRLRPGGQRDRHNNNNNNNNNNNKHRLNSVTDS